LYESLVTIEEKYARHPHHFFFVDLCDHLKRGFNLSTALKKYPKSFDRIYLCLVETGEKSGNLASIFEQLSNLLHRKQTIKKQIFSAFTYPAFLGAFCLLILSTLFFFIIPSMQELLEGRTLHPLTYLVLHTSKWACAHKSMILFLALLFPITLYTLFKHPKTRLFIHSLNFQIPFIKTLLLHTGLARFCQTVSMLLESGVSLIETLQLARTMLANPLLEEAIVKTEELIVEGEHLSSALQLQNTIPPLMIRMIALAEESGKMKEAFFNLSNLYEEEMEKHLRQLNTYLQPALLMLLGGVIGFVILSILLPLTDVNSFIE
ncbi:MAG: type II secretion system F family protein, partial [Chlamydiales bacterium]|nr:type II secretion system F family protein [Chlamydiales bacterium]